MPIEGQLAALAVELPHWVPLIAFLATIVGGELAVLLLSFVSGQGILPLPSVIIGGFLAMLTLDAFWFMLPRSRWGRRFKQSARVSERYRALEARIEGVSHRNDVLILFISKALVGTRILILAYLSVRSISFRRFMVYDAIATLLWTILLGGAGWFAGRGYYSLAKAESIVAEAMYAVSIGIVLYAAAWIVRRWITKG